MLKSIPKTVLVVKNRAMGDAIMGLSTIQYLKTLFPQSKIIYATPDWIAPLFKNSQTDCDQILPLRLKNIHDFFELFETCLNLKVDLVLELFQSGRTSKFFKLYSFLTKTPYYYHNHHTKSGRVHDQGVIKSNIQRDLDAAWTYFSNSKTIPNYLDYPPRLKAKNLEELKVPQIILGIVATRETKKWPLEYFSELTHLIQQKYQNYKIIIPLSKSPTDQKQKEILTSKLKSQTNVFFLEKKLEDLPLYLQGSNYYVGNDTGIKHLCVSLGIRTLTLFGPEPPLEWHPYDPDKNPYLFKEPLECRTKLTHYCGLSTCDSMICLNEFKPAEVLKIIETKFQS